MPNREVSPEYFGFKPLSKLAQTAGYSPATLRAWVFNEILCAVRINGVWHSTDTEVQRVIESRKRVGRPLNVEVGKPETRETRRLQRRKAARTVRAAAEATV